MSELCVASPGVEFACEKEAGCEETGVLLTPSGELEVVVLDSAEVSKEVFEFLVKINLTELPEMCDFEAMQITSSFIEIEVKIGELLKALEDIPETPKGQEVKKERVEATQRHTAETGVASRGDAKPLSQPKVYSSLFSLARDVNSRKSDTRAEGHHTAYTLPPFPDPAKESKQKGMDREGNGKQDPQKDQDGQNSSKKKKFKIEKTQASRSTGTTGTKGSENLQSADNIFIQFMALMARILSQSEAEAHALYQRIKGRTDNVDTLTSLIAKINSSSGKIDWSNDEEMKALVDKVRQLGVDIPEGKYAWTEDEKKLLKENIQMQKDSLEKITQLERTDMQRFLQESSQCHQARSNVLKLLKEVIDTINANIRP